MHQGGLQLHPSDLRPFPGNVDAMHLMWFMQAHHLDTDY